MSKFFDQWSWTQRKLPDDAAETATPKYFHKPAHAQSQHK